MRTLLLSLLPACAWVSQADVDKQLAGVDDDADGSPASVDCDDNDPRRYPGAVDAPYDGVDADCAFDDDFDADHDGYVPDDFADQETHGVPDLEPLPAGDCDDGDPTVSPAATDVWYDGLDGDCSGNDDYDQDGDGYVEDAYVGLPTIHADGTGALPGGDCDDEAGGVSPGAGDDWYDGIDSNCSGNDDYDQDGDGYVRPEDAGLATTYVDGSGGLPAGDCDDALASVYPGAPETWYDGRDSDCAGDDDYDQDRDGHGAVGYGDGDDCDDTTAEVYPGQVERLGDPLDSDCNGEPDGFPIAALSGCAWSAPHDPLFVTAGSMAYLSVVATEVNCGTRYYDSAVALAFDPADPLAGVASVEPWLATTSDPPSYAIADGQALVVDGSLLYGLVALQLTSGRALTLVRYDLDRGTRLSMTVQDAGHSTPYEDLALALSADGTLHAVGCESSSGVASYAQVAEITASTPDISTTVEGVYASACVLGTDDTYPRLYTAEGGALVRRDYSIDADELVLGAPQADSTLSPLDLDWDGGVLLYAADALGGSGLSYNVDTQGRAQLDAGLDTVRLDLASVTDLTVYGAVSADGRAWLGYGATPRGMTFLQLPVDFPADDVAVWTDGAWVLVAVTGGDQVVVGAVLAP